MLEFSITGVVGFTDFRYLYSDTRRISFGLPFFCLSSFPVPRGTFNRPRRKPITSDVFVTPVALCRRINNPAILTTWTYTSRPVCRHSKHFGRIICSTRFDTRVSVVSYLRSNVAPSTRARDARTNKKGKKKAAAWRRNIERRRRLQAIGPSLLAFFSQRMRLILIPHANMNMWVKLKRLMFYQGNKDRFYFQIAKKKV